MSYLRDLEMKMAGPPKSVDSAMAEMRQAWRDVEKGQDRVETAPPDVKAIAKENEEARIQRALEASWKVVLAIFPDIPRHP